MILHYIIIHRNKLFIKGSIQSYIEKNMILKSNTCIVNFINIK